MADKGQRDVKEIIRKGDIIRSYPNDKPYPSFLVLGFIEKRPLHVIISKDDISGECVIITGYEPSIDIWEPDYKIKKEKS